MKKNILKIAGLFVIAIALVFGFNLRVEALIDLVGETITYGNGNNLFFSGERLTYKYKYNDNYAYCIDPQYVSVHTGLTDDTNNWIGDGTNKYLGEYTAGLVAITKSSGAISDDDYLARMIAARSWAYIFGYSTSEGTYKEAMHANIAIAKTWAGIGGELRYLVDDLGEEKLYISIENLKKYEDYYYSGDTVLNSAKEYVKKAFQAAISYKSRYESNGSGMTVRDSVTNSGITEEGGMLKQDVIHTITLNGVTDSSNFAIAGLKGNGISPKVSSYVYKIEINEQTIASGDVSNMSQINLIKYYRDNVGPITDNKLVIKFTVRLEGKKADLQENCAGGNLKYSIEGSYGDDNISSQDNCQIHFLTSGQSGAQSYIIPVCDGSNPDSTFSTWTSDGSGSLVDCTSDCTKWENDCKNGDADACKEYIDHACPGDNCDVLDEACDKTNDPESYPCKKYDEVCTTPIDPTDPKDPKCEATSTNMTCCDKDDHLIIGEVEVEVGITGVDPDNVKYCFVDKADAGVKNVSDQNDNTYTMKSNHYCTVSCTEDYRMYMPAAKKVNAGRYFTFKAKIDGVKACYTNTIDFESFAAEFVNTQISIVDAYNKYERARALLDSEFSEVKSTYNSECVCIDDGCVSCSSEEYIASVSLQGNGTEYSAMGISGLHFNVKSIPQTYDASWTLNSLTPGETFTCKDHCTGKNCPNCRKSATVYTVEQVNTKEGIRKELEAEMETAKSDMYSLSAKLELIVKEYNECTEWAEDIEVKFDPDVSYDYYEKDYMNMIQNKDNMEMIPNTTSKNTTAWYCNAFRGQNDSLSDVSINNKYTECIGGEETRSIIGSTSNNNGEVRENLFIGDSRTYGLAIDSKVPEVTKDNSAYCWGEGFEWFTNGGRYYNFSECNTVGGESGINRINTILNNNKDKSYNIIIWLGANDLGYNGGVKDYPSRYFNKLKELATGDWKNHYIYVVSVGPIISIAGNVGLNNSNINIFNSELKKLVNASGLSNMEYIDLGLTETNDIYGNSQDGLHYVSDLNQRIYNKIVAAVGSGTAIDTGEKTGAKYFIASGVTCTESDCSEKGFYVSQARYVKVESTVGASYRPATLFYNRHYDGSITTNENELNVTPLKYALPVALSRPRGIYNYNIIMTNLGEFYDSGTLGRYAGSSNAMFGESIDYACTYLVNIQKETLTCEFNKGCTDDCVTDCIGPNCNQNDNTNSCDGVNCTTDCLSVGCIYDSKAGSSIYNREVSLNNFLYNGTTAYNWDVGSTNDKAKATVGEIKDHGEEIYKETPILSVKITPRVASEIRGSDNNDIRCESLSSTDGTEYQNVACYSNFITAVLDGEYGNIVNKDKSLISEDNNRNKDTYFKLWDGKINEGLMMGPSWK